MLWVSLETAEIACQGHRIAGVLRADVDLQSALFMPNVICKLITYLFTASSVNISMAEGYRLTVMFRPYTAIVRYDMAEGKVKLFL
jgi:hypothetical protein